MKTAWKIKIGLTIFILTIGIQNNSKDLTFVVVYEFQGFLYNNPYYGRYVRHLDKKLVSILIYHHLPQNRQSLRPAL